MTVCDDLSSVECNTLADPANCCPAGFSLAAYRFNCAVCLEDVPSDLSIVQVDMDLSMNLCTRDSGLTTCCPTGFTPVGFDENTGLICLGR